MNRGRVGSKQHEDELLKVRNSLIEHGWRVIRLHGKSPDAVAARVEDGEVKIVAVEILGRQYDKKKGWRKNWTYKQKHDMYSMFDDVFIKSFHRHRVCEGGGNLPMEVEKQECERNKKFHMEQ